MNRPGALERLVLPSGCAMRGASGTYTPDLSGADQNPYMADSALHGLADGKLWGNVRLVSNRLHGTTISASPPYDDSIILFPGTYGDNVQVTLNIYRTGTPLTTQEIEVLLCGTLGPSHASAYECMTNTGSNHYADIVRWNGGGGTTYTPPTGNYIEINLQLATPAVANGDEWKVTKIGNTITCYLNGAQVNTADVTTAAANLYGPLTYARGDVGVGFFQQGGTTANLLEFGVYNIQITAP